MHSYSSGTRLPASVHSIPCSVASILSLLPLPVLLSDKEDGDFQSAAGSSNTTDARRKTIRKQCIESEQRRCGKSIRSDLTSLYTLSDSVIVNCLHEHFMLDNIYTGIRTALVVVNPHKYAAEYRDITPGRVPLPPHIFQLANNAYYHMRRTGSNHAIQVRASCFHYIN